MEDEREHDPKTIETLHNVDLEGRTAKEESKELQGFGERIEDKRRIVKRNNKGACKKI